MSLDKKAERGECPVPGCGCRCKDEYYWFRWQDVQESIEKLSNICLLTKKEKVYCSCCMRFKVAIKEIFGELAE
jgi:hypothetical protein